MEFMLLFLSGPGGGPKAHDGAMQQFAAELTRQGRLPRGTILDSAAAVTRIRVEDGEPRVRNDGPDERAIEGFWIVDVDDRAAAIDLARRCPFARQGLVEVHPLLRRYTFTDPGGHTPFLFTFNRQPGLTDCDGAKLREMVGFAESLHEKGQLLETAPLAMNPPPARVETRSGNLLVTDGPFAEAKEGIGGYSLVRAADRAQALEIAKRYPHARWGLVEVRQARSFAPV